MDETGLNTKPLTETSIPVKTAGKEQPLHSGGEAVKTNLVARKPPPSRKAVPAPVTRAVVIRLINGVKRI